MGRKNEKTAGQPGELSCIMAREYFYGFTASELSSEARRGLSHHEASCPACGPEFREWRMLRTALQGSGIAPASDFKAGVMGRIRETGPEQAARRSTGWGMIWQHSWARGLAAAAVILIMLTGAAKLPAVEDMLAGLTRQGVVAFHPSPLVSPSQPGVQATAPPVPGNKTVIKPATTAITATATAPNSSVPAAPPVKTEAPAKTGGGAQIALGQGSGVVTASNKPMVITTTTLKVAVNDLEQASGAAQEIAGTYGANLTSQESAQDGHSNLLFLNFTVDPSTANVFLSHLSSLGGVLVDDKTNQDITGNYYNTLGDYKALLDQQAAADENEKGQYTSQINSLESELQNWSNASGKQVVILWLEH
jgi:hypothetical protein